MGEIPAAEGLTVIDEPNPTIPEDPRPSVPVADEPVAEAAPQVAGMAFIGTVVSQGMVGRANNGRVATLPVVVMSGGAVVGVVVLSDPGQLGTALGDRLEGAGYRGPFEFKQAFELSRETKLAAARCLATAQDPALDQAAAVMSFGFTLAMLAG